jgi:hypothetical protein
MRSGGFFYFLEGLVRKRNDDFHKGISTHSDIPLEWLPPNVNLMPSR